MMPVEWPLAASAADRPVDPARPRAGRDRLPVAMSQGIGLSNVKERLMVLYGDDGRFSLTGAPGQGARARVIIPLTVTGRRMAS